MSPVQQVAKVGGDGGVVVYQEFFVRQAIDKG
jgi:hypothetical protein